jgi:uncharacterized protein (DUF433 family)
MLSGTGDAAGPAKRSDMATTTPRALSREELDRLVDQWIVPDPYVAGRHNAVFRGGRTHLWSVLATLEGSGGNVAEAARAHGLPEDAVLAAIEYRERHRELFDAAELLRKEEWNS